MDLRTEVRAEEALLAKAVGGWRGLFDSSLPIALFVLAYLVTGNDLAVAVWSAVAGGALVAVWRLLRRQSVQQVLGGFAGVAISAWLASRTGQAEDFFLPGLLINLGYGAGFLVSILVGWPLLGFLVGGLTGDLTSWRRDPARRRAYAAASWVWVVMFALRLVVQLPLYLAGAVAALGVAKLALGWPLFLAAAYLSYRIITPVLQPQPVPAAIDRPESSQA